jgi:hypothetical protein
MAYGITVKQDTGGSRVEVQCEHQNALVYIVPAESSWVCSAELIHAHAMAGFFNELTRLEDAKIQALMQKWGIYTRERALEPEGGQSNGAGG